MLIDFVLYITIIFILILTYFIYIRCTVCCYAVSLDLVRVTRMDTPAVALGGLKVELRVSLGESKFVSNCGLKCYKCTM